MATNTQKPFTKTLTLVSVFLGITLLLFMSLTSPATPLHGAAPLGSAGTDSHVILGMLLILIGLSVHGLFLLRHEQPISAPSIEDEKERDAVLYEERHRWFEEGNLS
jgi:hypothetical protein